MNLELLLQRDNSLGTDKGQKEEPPSRTPSWGLQLQSRDSKASVKFNLDESFTGNKAELPDPQRKASGAFSHCWQSSASS